MKFLYLYVIYTSCYEYIKTFISTDKKQQQNYRQRYDHSYAWWKLLWAAVCFWQNPALFRNLSLVIHSTWGHPLLLDSPLFANHQNQEGELVAPQKVTVISIFTETWATSAYKYITSESLKIYQSSLLLRCSEDFAQTSGNLAKN